MCYNFYSANEIPVYWENEQYCEYKYINFRLHPKPRLEDMAGAWGKQDKRRKLETEGRGRDVIQINMKHSSSF